MCMLYKIAGSLAPEFLCIVLIQFMQEYSLFYAYFILGICAYF